MITTRQSSAPGCTVRAPMNVRFTHLQYLGAWGHGPSRSRQTGNHFALFTLVALLACLLVMPAWAGQKPTLPGGVPNLFDPKVRAQYEPTVVGNLLSNPDFPMVMLVNTTGSYPGAVLIALDARNGSDTWSLSTDPIILIALFADPSTITGLYFDNGLLTQGTPSGSYENVPNPREMLPNLLHALSEVAPRTYL